MDADNLLTKPTPVQEESPQEPFVQGPRGAFLLSVIAAGLLFIGWILFYFLIFMRRGYVG